MSNNNLYQAIEESLSRFNIDPETFYQIIRIFNISLDNSLQGNNFSTFEDQLKYKIHEIFITQGQNYKDYLSLPKFKTLKTSTLEKINDLFNIIWDKFQSSKNKEYTYKLIKQLQELIPKFKSLNEIEDYHLSIFTQYKQSRLCPLNTKNNGLSQQNLQYSNPQERNDFKHKKQFQQLPYMDNTFKYTNYYTNLNNMNNNMSNFNNSNNMRINPTKVQEPLNYTNNMWTGYKYNNNKQPVIMNPQYFSGLNNDKEYHNQAQQNHNSIYNKRQYLMDGIDGMDGHYQASKKLASAPPAQPQPMQIQNFLSGAQNQLLQRLEEYMFLECACQGKIKQSVPHMVCKSCEFCFHYECLLVSETSKQQYCPLCKLKLGSNMFIKIHEEPFMKRWYKYDRNSKLGFSLTQKQIEVIKKSKQNCKHKSDIEYQLRFQKLSRKNGTYQTNGDTNKNVRKFNYLPLPQNYIKNIKADNFFQVNIRIPQDYNKTPTQQQEHLFFFAIFLVQRYSCQQLVDNLFNNLTEQNSVGQQYLKKYLNQQQFINIKLKDRSTQNKILYPVRGNKCDHPQVLDYLSILTVNKEYGQKFKEIYCTECDSLCQKIIVDSFVRNKIKEKLERQQPKQYQVLRYFGQGRIQWDPQEISDSEPEPSISDNQQDLPVSQSISQEND